MSQTIEWQLADGSGAIAIAGATDAVGEFRIAATVAVQPSPGLRASAVVHRGRGNVAHRVSFLVTYAPAASAAAAKAAIATRTAALQPATLTHALLEGVLGATTWQLSTCALESYELWQTGLTVYGRYTFAGGAFGPP